MTAASVDAWPSGDHAIAAVPVASVCPVLVGRASELEALRTARAEGGGVVIVAGEAGIGKSRLLREFAQEVTTADTAVAWGRPETVSEPGPYSLLIDLLEDIATGRTHAQSAANELLSILTSAQPGREAPPARQIAARARGIIADLGDSPVVILEDLNAADEPSQAVIAHLARSARDDATMIVGALRSEEQLTPGASRLLDALHRDRLASRIELLPLERNDIRGMLAAMWEDEPSDDEVNAIWSLGEGVPFFTEELGSIRASSADIPHGIATAIAARLQRLSPEARRVLEAASLSHGALDPAVLAGAAAIPETEMPRCLMEGISAGLLADREGRIVYRHGLLRDAVAGSLVSVHRQALHRAVAHAIEASSSTDLDRYSFALAHHYKGAGEHHHAANWLVHAGIKSLANGAVEEASSLFSEALELAADPSVRARAFRGLAEVNTRLNNHASAIRLLSRAAVEWTNAGNNAGAADALAEEAWILATIGEPSATERIREALEHLGESDLRAKIRFRQAQVKALIGRDDLAMEAIREASIAAEEEGDLELIALCALELSRQHRALGEESTAQEYSGKARAIVLDHDLEHLVGRTFASEASIASSQGRNVDALEHLDEARSRLIEGLSSHHIVELDATRAGILWQMGKPDEADRVAKRIEIGRLARSYGRVISVWAAMERGDEAWARTYVDAWWERVGPDYRDLPSSELLGLPESPEGGQYAQLADSVIASYADVPSDRDEDRARRYWELCAQAVTNVWLQSTMLLLRCLIARRQDDTAEQVFAESELAVDELPPYYRALALEVRAALGAGASPSEDSLAALRQAETILREIGNASDRARVLIAIAAVVDSDEAKAHLREALQLASDVGAQRYARLAEAMLRGLGVRPRAGRPRGSARKEGLSSREEEVVTLVATGATNSEIAARLYLSERTVQDHLARAGKRLGVSGRAGLAAWAAKQGLI